MLKKTSIAGLVLAMGVLLSACNSGDRIDPINAVDSATAAESIQPGAYAAVRWDHPSNILQNASFEEGLYPWFSLAKFKNQNWMDFAITDKRALSGTHSAKFRMNSLGEVSNGTRIWGVIRDLRPRKLPRYIAGSYRVEDWNRGTAVQYLQVVIIVFPDSSGFPVLGNTPMQVAYILTGIDTPPFKIDNRKFHIAGPKEPTSGKWLSFHFDLHKDFEEFWGYVPINFSRIRVLFEARFDKHKPGEKDVRATVYYDDLYLGDGH